MLENKNERLIGQLERALEELKNGNDLEKVRNDVFDNLLQNGESLTELAQKATYSLVTDKINDMESNDTFEPYEFRNTGYDFNAFLELTSNIEKENVLALESIKFQADKDEIYKESIDMIEYNLRNEESEITAELELVTHIETGAETYFNEKLKELNLDNKNELSKSDLKEVANEVAKDMGKKLPYNKEEIENDRKLEKTNEKGNEREY